MKLLLVGAGAVGLVYAHHLRIGGAEVAFLVKPRHAESARKGFDLYPLDRRQPRKEPVRLDGVPVLTDADEARGKGYDATLLCVDTTALAKGDWLPRLAAATADATIVAFQTNADRASGPLEDLAAKGRLANGMIGIVSYWAPLPGESVPRPGVAYWLPPLSKSPFSGPASRVAPLVRAFEDGGLASGHVEDAGKTAAVPSAVLGAIVAGLKACGWSFAALRSGDNAAVTAAAAREMAAASCASVGMKAPFGLFALGDYTLSLLTRVAPLVTPLDLETYMRVHFTKVGEQMRQGVLALLEKGEQHRIPMAATRELARRSGAFSPSPAMVAAELAFASH